MSFETTDFRPLSSATGGGRVDWRGALSLNSPDTAYPSVKPQNLTPNYWGQVGTVFYRNPGATVNRSISGVTRDSAGTIMGAVRVALFQSGGDIPKSETVSDAAGNFNFDNPGSGPFYMVAYKAGSPDVAGTTVNTLIAV